MRGRETESEYRREGARERGCVHEQNRVFKELNIARVAEVLSVSQVVV